MLVCKDSRDIYVFFIQESGLKESNARLLNKLRKFSTRFLSPRKIDKLIQA